MSSTINKILISAFAFAFFLLITPSSSEQNKRPTEAHYDAYVELVEADSFPAHLKQAVSDILDDKTTFGLYEYYDVETEIIKHCLQDGFSSWKNTLSLLPLRSLLVLAPIGLDHFHSPYIAIERQVDYANTCEWKPLEYFMAIEIEKRKANPNR